MGSNLGGVNNQTPWPVAVLIGEKYYLLPGNSTTCSNANYPTDVDGFWKGNDTDGYKFYAVEGATMAVIESSGNVRNADEWNGHPLSNHSPANKGCCNPALPDNNGTPGANNGGTPPSLCAVGSPYSCYHPC